MERRKNEDLWVRKTREAIHNTFKAMICVMDYDPINIKELAQRARVNRRTFYLHYTGLDGLLTELQEKIAGNFIRRKISYSSMKTSAT